MGIEIPQFGNDMIRVSAYARFEGGWHGSRVLLPPLTKLGELYLSWEELAPGPMGNSTP